MVLSGFHALAPLRLRLFSSIFFWVVFVCSFRGVARLASPAVRVACASLCVSRVCSQFYNYLGLVLGLLGSDWIVQPFVFRGLTGVIII